MHDESTPDRSADDTEQDHGDDTANNAANNAADGVIDSSPADAIAVELGAAAAGVEVGDASTMLTAVRSTATRRRRRRNTVVGLAAAGTLVVSGAIVANLVGGSDGDDLIVSAPATEAPTSEAAEPDDEPDDETDTLPATVVTDAPGDITPVAAGDPVPVRLVPAQLGDVVDPGLTIDATVPGQSRLLRWQDGFLSIRTTYEPQPLPTELPPEIVDLFPPEVTELFPDGLPATIAEATQILQDAGLLDEVTDVISANQEVYDAIYSEQGDVDTSVRFSTDGIEWTDTDAEFPVPDNLWSEVRTTADRVVIVVQPDAGFPEPAGPAEPQFLEVYSSVDLVTWEVQQVPLPAPPTDLAPAERYTSYPSGIAVSDVGYLVSIQLSVDVDPIALLDPETRDRVNSSAGGVSVSYGDEGVTVELYGADGFDPDVPAETTDTPPEPPAVTETLTYTWEELGLDGPPNHDEESVTWTSTWGGQPTRAELSSQSWVIGVGDEFVELGPTPRRSADGIDWIPIELPTDGYVDSIIETPDGVALRMTDGRGSQATYVGDLATGEWTTLDTPDIPESAYSEQLGSGAFLLASYGPESGDPYADSLGSRQSAEVDGYRYELEVRQGGGAYSVGYTLTDIATGEVIVSETADGLSAGDDPFEFVGQGDFGGSDITILDPATGEPLVVIPFDAMTQEVVNADGTVTDVSEGAFEYAEPSAPSYWVLAPVGDGWIVEQIDSGAADGAETALDEQRWPSGVVAVGDVVLVGWSDGTFTRVTAT